MLNPHELLAMTTTWTELDFDQLSWHDNAVHGLQIIEGQHGCGDIVLDLDYILEWQGRDGRFHFSVAPATLTFHEASSLKITIDYGASSAALTPFAIHQIGFESVAYSNGATGRRWKIEINWPNGEIVFEAPRFTQILTGKPMNSTRQSLSQSERERLKISPGP